MTLPIRGILLDIEGTTTPIAFVHEVLFPYARSRVRDYVTAHFGSQEFSGDLTRLRTEHYEDAQQKLDPPPLLEGGRDVQIDSVVRYVDWLMDRDRKSTGLKSLQGRIWRHGYLDGTLKASVFADVPPALQRWSRAGLKISIFSSGSSLAQRLLFQHTEAGDLTGFISDYFDTTLGSKTDVESYRQIAAALHLAATEMLFISDVVGELDAASQAGMQILLSVRPGNQPQTSSPGYRIIQTFNDVL